MERLLLGGAVSESDAVARASAVLNAGGIAALPAEGLYGFHVRPDRPAALERLGVLKPREGRRGWIGLIADSTALARYAGAISPRADALVLEYWPGPLTLVVAASPAVPTALRGDDGTVALRCPGSGILRAIIRNCGGLLISTSANAPGAPPPARPEDVPVAGIDLILDGGPLSGLPSTIVRIEGDQIRVVRTGAIPLGEGTLDGPESAS